MSETHLSLQERHGKQHRTFNGKKNSG